ncbi:hypothetical protein BD413DRAFT_472983 [Trametes elegans]|nr:hypothetical protein BD413DRAFT_472983 [Trametes elegans]
MSAVFQNAFYIGNNFNTILYGVELVVYYLTIEAVLQRSRRLSSPVPRSDKIMVAFSTALLLLNTVFVATEAVFGEEMWVVNADYPGGPEAYLGDFASVWYQTFGTAASIVLNLLSDALLIYRCYIIWADVRVILFPFVLYLGTFSLGIAQLVASGLPHSDYFAGFAQKLGIAYTSCIISLEIIVSALIGVRIVRAARLYRAQSQRDGEHGSEKEDGTGEDVARAFIGPAALFVESALACTLLGIVYLATFARNSDLSIFFLSIYVMTTCLAPQMIILRIVRRRAWTRETTETIMMSTTMDDPERPTFMSTSMTHAASGVAAGPAVQKEAEAGFSLTV